MTREDVLQMLTAAYESAVVQEAQRRGGNPRHFVEAASMLPPEVFDALRASFIQQIDDLR